MNTDEQAAAAVHAALASARRVVFDFDGTLVDSNAIKRRAFDMVFAGYPDRMEAIQAYCHSFNHTIRGEKFRHVTEKILHLPYTPERDRECHELYARFTTDSVAQAPEIPGATAFLRRVQKWQPGLLSSTPHDILLEILDRRGWRSLFHDIQGAPIDKRSWLTEFGRALKVTASEILFFGDTDEDEGSAREAGCRFVRVGQMASSSLSIPDFSKL